MKKVFFTILVFILGIALGFGIMYVVNDDSKNSTKEENNNSDITEQESNKELEITDTTLKTDLITKIVALSYLSETYYSTSDYNSDSFKLQLYSFSNDLYENLNLSEGNKLLLALNSSELKDDYISDNKKSGDIRTYIDNYNSDLIEGLKEQSTVENVYNKYFGTKEINHQTVGKCPSYNYDSVNKVYYEVGGCGGTGAGYVYFYKNKFTTMDNEAYVYINIGTSSLNSDDTTYNICKDLDPYNKGCKDVYKQNISSSEIEQFKIDSTNAHNFYQYKFTFEKDTNGNYYFKSISKVN